jgi:hypothetical protein
MAAQAKQLLIATKNWVSIVRVIRQHTIDGASSCSSLFGFSHFSFLYPNALFFLFSPAMEKNRLPVEKHKENSFYV